MRIDENYEKYGIRNNATNAEKNSQTSADKKSSNGNSEISRKSSEENLQSVEFSNDSSGDVEAKQQALKEAQQQLDASEAAYSEATEAEESAQEAFDSICDSLEDAKSSYKAQEKVVSKAKSKVSKEENKPWYKKICSGIANFFQGLVNAFNKAVASLKKLGDKVAKFMGLKNEKRDELEKQKGISKEAKEKLEEDRKKVEEAQKLLEAAQAVQSASTGEIELSQEDVSAIQDILNNAINNGDELFGAEGSELQTSCKSLVEELQKSFQSGQIDAATLQEKIKGLKEITDQEGLKVNMQEQMSAELTKNNMTKYPSSYFPKMTK